MQDSKEGLAERLRIFLESHGIDPMYAGTVFVVLIVWSYRKDLKRWDEIEGWQKAIIGSAVLAAIVFSIISLLRLAGIISLK